MKTILALVLLGASQLCVSTPLPEPGVLRVPRIYNALITTDAKLQPSRASPYSVPAIPVIGSPLANFAHVEEPQPHHHATGKKAHHDGQSKTEMDHVNVHATGKIEKKPSSRMYPETFYPQSVGYYPHPFIPYSYPLAPQPYPFGQYSSAGVGGGPESLSAFSGPGFAAVSGPGAGFGSYSGLPLGSRGMPPDFAIDQSSSFHMTSGRRHRLVNAGIEQVAGSDGAADEGDEVDEIEEEEEAEEEER